MKNKEKSRLAAWGMIMGRMECDMCPGGGRVHSRKIRCRRICGKLRENLISYSVVAAGNNNISGADALIKLLHGPALEGCFLKYIKERADERL